MFRNNKKLPFEVKSLMRLYVQSFMIFFYSQISRILEY